MYLCVSCIVPSGRHSSPVPYGIAVEVVVMERIGLVSGTLFNMEVVVSYVGIHTGLVHKAVVFFRAIAGVGYCHRWQMSVTVEEGVKISSFGSIIRNNLLLLQYFVCNFVYI